MAKAGHRLSIHSIRVRTTITSLLIVGIVVGVVGVGLVLQQHRSLLADQQTRVSSEAASIALALSEGRSFTNFVRPGTGFQVVTASGQVAAASEALYARPPISTIRPPVGTRQTVPLNKASVARTDLDDGIGAIEATTVKTAQGPLTVYAAVFGGQVERSTGTLVLGLAIGFPLILLVTGVLTWFMTGVALRPVEEMRIEVASVVDDDLETRVEVPPGGDEITKLAVTLNEMLDRLELAQATQRAFVSDASHELRSPIASLLATIEVARAHPEAADWGRVATVIDAEASRLKDLVDDLFWLSTRNERRRDVDSIPVDLDDLVFFEAERLRLEGRLTVTTRQVSAARTLGDPLELQRVIRNVIDNASRHAATAIELSLVTDGEWIHLRVADDGEGVDPATAHHLFDRFARSDAARDRPSGGAGLGLAIVAAVVGSLGGSARFIPVDKGATVELTLPSLS